VFAEKRSHSVGGLLCARGEKAHKNQFLGASRPKKKKKVGRDGVVGRESPPRPNVAFTTKHSGDARRIQGNESPPEKL